MIRFIKQDIGLVCLDTPYLKEFIIGVPSGKCGFTTLRDFS
ncbi:hypothetical protein [Ilyobacter polytropus]|nr:hypothetical protein [Ilyobacter polytropus]